MIIGIDPGTSGALVLLHDDGKFCDHLLMPTIKVGSGNRVNGAAIAGWIGQWRNSYGLNGTGWDTYLERVGAMPKQGVSSTFTFGHAAGLVEGVVTGAGIPLTLVTPQAWKKAAGLIGTDKDAARSRAIQLYPELRILDAKGKGQAIADAILIARFGRGLSV
ncbi:hypothetical protein [Agrobacterium tumefaciens]|uniref:hypothetical protein n=1 Tax=Agrobacterium tumefaciens TaxID=358 RepID=UPI0015726A01|nr:hypothetical protein [Agrobacterium tumefaciens]